MEKENLFGKTKPELHELVTAMGLPAFTASQLCDWMYKKKACDFQEMTNLSKKARELLSDRYTVGRIQHTNVQESVDGTKKYLFPSGKHNFIEAAYIPEEKRNTLCISSQAGCKMGCLFCMTGKQGFQANLSPGEIVNQLLSIPESELVSNLVFMGMGEPFDNMDNLMKSLEILTSTWGMEMSPRRITVSTIGIIPAMNRFIAESECHLAISLHTPFEDERKKLMPIENVYPLEQIFNHLKSYDFPRQRRISFEYIMFKGLNDTRRHVNELVRLMHGMKARINLIRFHPVPGTPLEGSDDTAILAFKDALNAKGVTTTIRASRGLDIAAACGLLSTKELLKREEETDY
ncbi:MAG TPA: 23S rRNA (adenine(2503)-C(2))-methyltransferase RlmN [Bacteroidales bacterium]|nr:23S rRNA (adenine(2503)-C(2))-methyltransferase RlmN [Bacteroidales bacterium]